jgi:arylformamidase
MDRYLDISMPLEPRMPTFPGDPPFLRLALDRVRSNDPASYNLSVLIMSSHTGTHVDSPRHFLPKGRSVDMLDWRALCGEATVLDLGPGGPIGEKQLRRVSAGGKLPGRLLLKTATESYLTRKGAEYLRDGKVRLVGIDSLSVDVYPHARRKDPFPAHHVLLGAKRPVVIVEGLCLANVQPGEYTLLCMPLRIVGGDGAPARALLVQRRDPIARGWRVP